MSSSGAANPEPSVIPQDPAEAKGEVEPFQPGRVPALRKVPDEVKTTVTKADATILRLSK